MANSLQKTDANAKMRTIAEMLEPGTNMYRHLALACSKSVTPERLSRILLTELRRVPGLLECTQQSLFGALMQCAQLGIEPGPMGLAFLIPYRNTADDVTEAQFQLGYKGTLSLVWRSNMVSSVQAEVVCKNDHFEYRNGIPPVLEHKPAEGDRGPQTHAYAVIGTVTGGWIFRVMTADEIEEHRKRFSKARSSPWDTDWDEMACKTLIKRVAKRAPVSAEAATAIALDDQAEIGFAQNLGAMFNTPELGAPREKDVTQIGCEHPDGFSATAASGDDEICIHCGETKEAVRQ